MIGRRSTKLRLKCVHIHDKINFFRLAELIGFLNRLPEIGQRFAESLKFRIDLIAIPERNDVLASSLNLDSFEPVSRKHAWSSNSVHSCGCDYEIVGRRRDLAARPCYHALRDRLILYPSLIFEIGQIAVDLLRRQPVAGLQVCPHDANCHCRASALSSAARSVLVSSVQVSKNDLPNLIVSEYRVFAFVRGHNGPPCIPRRSSVAVRSAF
jgi:hypothetical protein